LFDGVNVAIYKNSSTILNNIATETRKWLLISVLPWQTSLATDFAN